MRVCQSVRRSVGWSVVCSVGNLFFFLGLLGATNAVYTALFFFLLFFFSFFHFDFDPSVYWSVRHCISHQPKYLNVWVFFTIMIYLQITFITTTDPTSCNRFQHCFDKIAYKKTCPGGLVWDTYKNKCGWPGEVIKGTQLIHCLFIQEQNNAQSIIGIID